MRIKLSDHFTYSRLIRFTLPAIITMVFTFIYGVVDGLFVTNFAGKTALAAINFAFPILNILATFGYMFGVGGSALVAKTLGKGNKQKANGLFSTFVYISTVIGFLFTALGFIFLRPILIFLGAEDELLRLSLIYGRILLIALPFWNLQFLFQMFFVTAEKPRLSLYVTLVAGITNIVLDAILVAIFNLGITGAAIATALSQIVGGLFPIFYFASKNTSLLRLGKMYVDFASLIKGITNGASEFISGTSGSLVGILYNTRLMTFAGEDGVAAYSIMMYVGMTFLSIFFGFCNGVSPIIGYNYGANNTCELKNVFKKCVVTILSASLIMLILSEIFAKPLAIIFSGYDPYLLDMTLNGLRIYAISFAFSGLAIFGSSFFTALNDGLTSAILSFSRTIVFQVSTLLLLPIFFDLNGIWFSIVAAELLAFSLTLAFIIIKRKKYSYL